jgi:hypothetical protein
VESLIQYGLSPDHHLGDTSISNGHLVTIQEQVEAELSLILKNSSLLDDLLNSFEFKRNMDLTLLDTLDLIKLDKLAQNGIIKD